MTLYKVADTTKKALIIVVAVLSIILVVRVIVGIIDGLSRTLITEFSVATRGFGDLPALTLSQVDGAENQIPAFSVETLSGKLPTTNTLFNVYRIVQPTKTLSSEEFSLNVATTFGFSSEPDKISAIEWEWEEGGKKLSFNVQNQHFLYSNQTITQLEDNELPTEPDALFEPLLEELGYEIPNGRTYRFEYIEEVSGKFVPTPNFQSSYVRISLVTSLNYNSSTSAETVSAYYQPSSIYVIISNQSDAGLLQVREMGYSLWAVDTENKQTYYGITAEDAYSRLEQGGGALAWAAYTRKAELPDIASISNVRITDVNVGYFCPEAYITYLQPVYLFYAAAGDGENRIDLLYYVPAL